MVLTRKQQGGAAQTACETERQQQICELRRQQKRKAVAKLAKMSRHSLRDSVRTRIGKKDRRGCTVIGSDNERRFCRLVEEKLNCPICLQLILEPILTPCGHAFCLPCIEESLKHKNACSLCRHIVTLEEPMPSKLLKNMLGRVSAGRLSGAELEEYNKRRESFEEREMQRRVSSEVKLGDLVDFYMDRGWHEGKVVQIRQEPKGKILKIKSAQNQSRTRELGTNSRLLARYRSFTKEPVISRRNSIFMFDFEDSLFNSISNSVFFFLDSPVVHRLEMAEIQFMEEVD